MTLRNSVLGTPFLATAFWVLASPAPAATPTSSLDESAAMLRYPDVSAEHIVFVFANDLWLVARDGGVATPLASPEGSERAPKFNPAGTEIAFRGNYEGDGDLYTVPVAGGIPYRVTHQPGSELLSDWGPTGQLVFSSNAFSGQPGAPKMYTVAPTGGLPTELPIPYGLNGTIAADGKTLAYSPNARDNRNWKRYRGGTASEVWLFDLESLTSQRVTTWEGTDSIPMWHAGILYYMSDRGPEQRLNIWSFDPATGAEAQLTNFTDYDVKWPSIGPGDAGQGEIVFQNGAGLMLLDLGSGVARNVDISVPGARESIRPKNVDVAEFVQAADIAPSGKRAVVEARGDIWTLPKENGSPRNLTQTDGIAEREPAWSPDGRWIAYFADGTGEYELYVTQSDGRGETRQLTSESEGFRYAPTWSPDSTKIAFSDRSGSIFLHDIESSATTFVAQDMVEEWGVRVAWSHDSRWLTFAMTGDRAMTASIYVYDIEAGELSQVTSDMFSDGSPSFDRMGDFLYFYSSRNFNGQTSSMIDTNYVYRDSEVLLAVPLRADVEYPWAPESDEQEWEEEGEDGDGESDDEAAEEDADAEDGDADAEQDDTEDVVDDGVSGRYEGSITIPEMGTVEFKLTLELKAGRVSGDFSAPLGTAFFDGTWDPESGEFSGEATSDEGDVMPFSGTLKDGSLELTVSTPDGDAELRAERTASAGATDEEGDESDGDDEPAEVVEIELDGFERRALALPVQAGSFTDLTVNNKNQLLYVRQGDDGGIKLFDIHSDELEEEDVTGGSEYRIAADGKHILVMRGNKPAIAKAAAGASPKNAVTEGMTARIDPRNEWPQLFTDAWRFFRDYFYAANMHGVDWKGVHDHYRPMIDACATRNDVDYVIREMVAELNCGHTYVRGGPLEQGPRVGVGMLGCDFELDNGAYRIAAIREGGSWDSDARGPLSQPGVDVAVGDYLLAVNGVPLDTNVDPWAAFVGTAGKSVELTVSQEPVDGEASRSVWVETMSSERGLRYRDWIESNRAHVFEQSGGRVAYVYVPDTGQRGRNDFFRQLYGQAHLDAMIIDERWNGGGQFPNREIEALDRPRTNYWGRRWGRSYPTPQDSHQGPKCMLINRNAGSGGDMFPYLFKQAGLGKLVGMRTWGGLVGYSGSPTLIDGGTLAVPSFGFYELDGTWGVEGHGVDPDIEVIDDPALMQDGADPQLDAAIQLMLEELETDAYAPPTRPLDPDRSGFGVAEEDRNGYLESTRR